MDEIIELTRTCLSLPRFLSELEKSSKAVDAKSKEILNFLDNKKERGTEIKFDKIKEQENENENDLFQIFDEKQNKSLLISGHIFNKGITLQDLKKIFKKVEKI